MILTGSYLILLDPSGQNLPEDWGKNSYVVPLASIRRYGELASQICAIFIPTLAYILAICESSMASSAFM